MGLTFQTEGAGNEVAPRVCTGGTTGLWMGGGDVDHCFRAGGQQCSAFLVVEAARDAG